MADRIVFNYPEMESSVSTLRNISGQYQAAGQSLIAALDNATATWQGASRDKFMALVNGSIRQYVEKSVPEMVTGLATLLANNAKSMQEADNEIAKNIPDSI